MITLPEPLRPLAEHLLRHGTFPVVVGGYVRDALLEHTSKDIDIEVYSVRDFETLKGLLEPFGRVCAVGKSFGVLKLAIGGYDIDVSLPRTESKTGPGHRGFDVRLNPQLDFATAARRRDFTVNAMGFDLHSSYLLDPYGGQADLRAGILRCVAPATFVEDPLRVLRAVQMAARFHLECTDALLLLCRRMIRSGSLDELPRERVFEELKKLLLKAERPSVGLRLMERIDLLGRFPELDALHRNTGQWEATLRAVDLMAALRSDDPEEALVLMTAALCHNFAKPSGGAGASADTALAFLERITDDRRFTEAVTTLVARHLDPERFWRESADAPAIRRLALAVPLVRLAVLSRVHHLGSGTPGADAGAWLLKEAERLRADPEQLRPLLQGRDLIAAGFTPSPRFKSLLNEAFEAQLDGAFENREGALEWLNRRISDNQTAARAPASDPTTSR